MAKSLKTNNNKVSFGKKRKGKAKRKLNKHDNKEHNYRGQGK